ncbi:hypothetical protein H5410_005365 [Solanum commersonii]|uniref:Uncharacterized protein n=1 Tax=Solanum commersonii TaxID=4109 RepID=A0A9J6A791_SOLCO|nr:hypothetical protein H5410_005365 [Solanum commersonii]
MKQVWEKLKKFKQQSKDMASYKQMLQALRENLEIIQGQLQIRLMGTKASELKCLNIRVVRDGPCLSVLEQRDLNKGVTTEEILEAIKCMPKDKALGVDGFPIECARLNNIHICFDDDLLMYCMANLIYVNLMQATFKIFSEASGLQENIEKSSIYIVGVTDHIKQRIIDTLGFTEGTMSFRYLGVPLVSQKLGINAYLSLIEKIAAKITFITAVEQLCRTFLWAGDVIVSKKVLVSWVNICLPGATGGLNVMNICTWNNAAILKLLSNIYRKSDCLWVQWVHSYYIKVGDMSQVRIPKNDSWVIMLFVDRIWRRLHTYFLNVELPQTFGVVYYNGWGTA